MPPPTVNAMATCGNAGVAVVETQQSFLNGLVGVLTFGIYTPIQITVTCGQGEQQDELPEVTSAAELQDALDGGESFYIRGENLP